jgi:hypothetical protein
MVCAQSMHFAGRKRLEVSCDVTYQWTFRIAAGQEKTVLFHVHKRQVTGRIRHRETVPLTVKNDKLQQKCKQWYWIYYFLVLSY